MAEKHAVSVLVEYIEDGKIRISSARTMLVVDGEDEALRIYGECASAMEKLKPWAKPRTFSKHLIRRIDEAARGNYNPGEIEELFKEAREALESPG